MSEKNIRNIVVFVVVLCKMSLLTKEVVVVSRNRTGKGRAVSSLLWSPDGSMYVIAVGTEVNVYDVHTAGIVHTFQLAKKVTCICFFQVNAGFYLDIRRAAVLGHIVDHCTGTKNSYLTKDMLCLCYKN